MIVPVAVNLCPKQKNMRSASSIWQGSEVRLAAHDHLKLLAALERVAAAACLLVLSPALLAVALVIVLLSRRGPLISHTRVGLHGKPLHMLKFRTMWGRDKTASITLRVENVNDAIPARKSSGDARVNGRFATVCRRHSIDELPQLWHVARGQMSLVGPRPITRSELDAHYGGCIDEVLSVRPGVTGLWQVMGRNKLTYARRRRLDLLFVRHASAGLYFRILLLSIPRVLKGTGAG
jgi:exopolysaccharide production protein ExoY